MGSEARVRSPIYLPPQVLKSHDAAAGTSTGILTWHTKDLEGEIIRPAGVRFQPAPTAYPVDWLHGVVVGKGFVERKQVPDKNADGSEVWRVVPVGTSHFFRNASDLDGADLRGYSRTECLDAGNEAAELVFADVAPGISIEFDPLSKVYLGKSLLKPAGAYRYDDCRLVGWAHTPMGRQVQPWAQTLLAKSLEFARSGKLPSGRAMSATIRKAFDPLLAANPSPATVTVPRTVGKAMPPDDLAPPMDPSAVDAPPVEEPATQEGPPTAKAAYDAAQGCSDMAAGIREMVKASEHLKGKAKLLKLADELDSCAEDASAIGDMVTSDVGGSDDDLEATDESDETPADDTGADEPDEKKDKEEKALKILPLKKSLDGSLQTATGYAPRRFSFRDVKAVEKAATEDEPPAAPSFDLRHLNRRLSRIRPTRN